MQLAAHELSVLSELTMSCVVSITNMAYMLQHVQDGELKAIVERHFPMHVRDYNMKVEFLHQTAGAEKELSLLKENGNLSDYTKSTFGQYPSIQPRTMIDNMNDREMAAGYLLTLKRAGREYAWLAMEAANPELRGFLQTAFMMSCSHAYDMWQYMVGKGYYPLEPADATMVGKVGGMFQVIPEDQPQIQQYLRQYKNPAVSSSGRMS
jgi:spore coat protein CotF